MRASTVCFLLLAVAATVCVALAFFIDGGSRGGNQQLQVFLAVIFAGGALTSLALAPRSKVDGARRRRWFRPVAYAACAIFAVLMLSLGTFEAFEAFADECVVLSIERGDPPPDCAPLHVASFAAWWLSVVVGVPALSAIVPVLLAASLWDRYRTSHPAQQQASAEA